MRTKKLLVAALAAFLGASALGGCVVRGTGYTYARVRVAPPPPRHVVVETRPGWVYVDGYWDWNGYEYVWRDGYWERDRPGYVYVRGYWSNDRGNHRYHRHTWRRADRGNNNVIIYKHGNGRRPNNNKPVIVHDHSK
jgi:hypothetical protein